MNATNLTQVQEEALLDLLVIAMYADGHIASVEDGRLQRLLTDQGHSDEYDRSKLVDGSITRTRKHTQTPEHTRAYIAQLAQLFQTSSERRSVVRQLDDLLSVDGATKPKEKEFSEEVQRLFKL